jgi:hypothetical protein
MKVAGNETGETMRNVTNNKKIVSSSKQQQQQQPFGWLAEWRCIIISRPTTLEAPVQRHKLDREKERKETHDDELCARRESETKIKGRWGGGNNNVII